MLCLPTLAASDVEHKVHIFRNIIISMTVVLPFQEYFTCNFLKGKFFIDAFSEVGRDYENGYHGLNIPHYQLSA
jgi:hypothetical protein